MSETAGREHEFKFLVPDDFEMPGLDDLCAPIGRHRRRADGHVLRHRRPATRARRRVVAVPRRRRLDREAAHRLRRRRRSRTLALASSSSAAAPRPRPRRRSSSSPRWSARRGSRPPRGCAPFATGPTCAADPTPSAPSPTTTAPSSTAGSAATSVRSSSNSPTTRPRRPSRDVVERLRGAGAADGEPLPKVVRALGPTATLPADVVSYSVGKPATVDAVIRHAISDPVAKLVANDPVVRIGEDPEGVHQARVATRRLRSHLRTFRDLLDPEWAQSLRDELGWLGDELGAVRDADVLLERLARSGRRTRARRPARGGATAAAAPRRPRGRARVRCSTGCAATVTCNCSTGSSTPRSDLAW